MKGGLYRSRLSKDIDPRSQRFIGSLNVDSEFLQYEVECSLAHVVMLEEQKWVTRRQAADVIKALKKTAEAGVPLEGFEDIHEFVETSVTQLTSKDTGGRLHTARSRNDQVATITRMLCRDRLLQLIDETEGLVSVLLQMSRRYSSTPMLAYTHLGQAQLQTLGHHLQSYAEPLLRDVERLSDCFGRTNECPLGASAVAGSTIAVDRRRTSELLGFSSPVVNCEDAVESRDYAVEAIFVQTLLLVELSRMAEDLIVWSTTEFAYFELPDELASPSSAMPHKKNADVLEIVRADAALGIAELVQALTTLKGLTSGYNRDLQNVKAVLARSFPTTLEAISVLKGCLEGGKFDVSEMRKKAEDSDVFALPLAEWLVRKQGIAFRQAHSIAGRISGTLSAHKEKLADLGEGQLAALIRQAEPDLNLPNTQVAELRRYLHPEAVLKATKTEGGPSKERVLANYTVLRKKMAELNVENSKKRKGLLDAKRELHARVDAII